MQVLYLFVSDNVHIRGKEVFNYCSLFKIDFILNTNNIVTYNDIRPNYYFVPINTVTSVYRSLTTHSLEANKSSTRKRWSRNEIQFHLESSFPSRGNFKIHWNEGNSGINRYSVPHFPHAALRDDFNGTFRGEMWTQGSKGEVQSQGITTP